MSQPAATPDWNTSGANRTDPGATQKSTGWTVSQSPPSSYFNWYMNLVGQWVQYLKNLTSEVLTWGVRQIFGAGLTATGSTGTTGITSTGGSSSQGVLGIGGSNGIGVQGNGTGTGSQGVLGVGGSNGVGVQGNGTGTGQGVLGVGALNGTGVEGQGTGTGVGVAGSSAGAGDAVKGVASGTGNGVKGTASGGGHGVQGTSTGAGYGVSAVNDQSAGVALYGSSALGTALNASSAGAYPAANIYSSGTGTTLNVQQDGDSNAVVITAATGNGIWASGGFGASSIGILGECRVASGVGVKGSGLTYGGYGIVAEGRTASPTKAALRVIPQGAAPSSPLEGDIYFNSTNHLSYRYNGTTWIDYGQAQTIRVMTSTAMASIPSPAVGDLIYQSDFNKLYIYLGGATWKSVTFS